MQIFADKVFREPKFVIEAFDANSLIDAFQLIEKYKSNNYYLVGYIRYEAKEIFLGNSISSKLPLLYFEVFDTYEVFDYEHSEDNFVDLINPIPSINYSEYKTAIEKIKLEISEGNTYQVNYTYDYNIEKNIDSFLLYKAVLQNQRTPYNSFFQNKYEEFLSFSPELFFELSGNKIKTKPMKGTIKRGCSYEEDISNISFLKNDEKNRAENVMIVDLLRNDLGKIAKTGTVKVDKLFEIESHKTVYQMTSEISAQIKDNFTLYNIFEAIFPCGSITGAPKISTMNIIDELEKGDRNIYCGAIGVISKDETIFSVPIRLLHRFNKDDFYTLRVGGAIVWDSTADDEWQETITKIKFLGSSLDYKLVETMKSENKKIIFFEEHMNRLRSSAKKLGFVCDFLSESIKKYSNNDGFIRVTLSRSGEIDVEVKHIIDNSTNKVEISDRRVHSKNLLLYHKTTHRPWYKLAQEKIATGLIYDEIFLNEKGQITEGARSNIIIEKAGKFYTPPTSVGLLNGIYRQSLIDKKEVIEKVLLIEDLQHADKIFCVNSVRGMKEVTLI